ncbi:hypothetical protein JCM17844_11420 [Iodidimonas gelatinilytica]|uniref:Ribosomal protein S1 n=1 Tax=Iodidimonas gelatinilytica TaxID=1236966 RepID=A0A5A7MR93_9PROT|nr:DUF6489 family protein [Iodidimonas gelatinilytica]GEQ97505.1 hypothetical protein JCM17844_11420 [Iodidimonas gelatinilytica]GER01590.1 hypothetical protein JCM17845_22130 [Iodidimonas gelatinilytica]
MKISVDVDCTPKELRTFFGLPDVEPLQEEILAQMKRRASEGLSPEDMQNLMSAWMTGATTGMEKLQKMMFSAMKPSDKPRG